VNGDERYNITVLNPHWEIHGDELFLVGTCPVGGSAKDWSEGITSGIAWNKITDYMVFDSVSEYRKRLHRFNKAKRK
jgi:hypothetical protein